MGKDPGQVGPSSAGLSGDTLGLDTAEEVTVQSVEDLVSSGQYYEASTVEGFEEAADHPEQPVPNRSNKRLSRMDESVEAAAGLPDEALSSDADDAAANSDIATHLEESRRGK